MGKGGSQTSVKSSWFFTTFYISLNRQNSPNDTLDRTTSYNIYRLMELLGLGEAEDETGGDLPGAREGEEDKEAEEGVEETLR